MRRQSVTYLGTKLGTKVEQMWKKTKTQITGQYPSTSLHEVFEKKYTGGL